MKDPAYVEFSRLLWVSVMDAKLEYAYHHPGAPLRPDTEPARESLVKTLVGMAYRRFPRNKLGQYMVSG